MLILERLTHVRYRVVEVHEGFASVVHSFSDDRGLHAVEMVEEAKRDLADDPNTLCTLVLQDVAACVPLHGRAG